MGPRYRVVPLALCISGCSSIPFSGAVVGQVVGQIENANHAQYQAAELIMCRGITVGEWMRSIGPYPEKVAGWRALCVGNSLPEVPSVPVVNPL